MFDPGLFELLIVLVLALIVLGPERLPKVARTAGTWAGQARRLVRQLRTQLDYETSLKDLDASLKETLDEPAAPTGAKSARTDGSPDGPV